MTNRQYRLADFNRALQNRIMRKRATNAAAEPPDAAKGAPAEESYDWGRFKPQWTNTATGLLTALLAGYVGHHVDGARGAAIGASFGLPAYGAASHFELGDQLEEGYGKAKAGVQEWWKNLRNA